MDFNCHMASYSLTELIEFTHDYEQLEKDGSIGECSLRTAASQLIKESNNNYGGIVLCMHTIAFYAYRRIANAYMTFHKESLESAPLR